MVNAYAQLSQFASGLKLRPISAKEILINDEISCPIYALEKGLYAKVFDRHQQVPRDMIKDLLVRSQGKIYTDQEGQSKLVEVMQDQLRSLARRLSIGNPQENAKKVIHYLTLNMNYLYLDPTDDLKLNLQYQSARGLAHFLMNNLELHSSIYYDYIAQKYPYIIAQPFLSSLFLLGILKQTKSFSDKEIESLFIASYFKDIGMSLVPASIYNSAILKDSDREILKSHPEYSTQILAGRIPINTNGLRIIEQHHSISVINTEEKKSTKAQTIISGIETSLVIVTDIIAAMISERPYRDSTTLFKSLELVKNMMNPNFQMEFKIIVSHFKNFFK